jgi:hypothetical protein
MRSKYKSNFINPLPKTQLLHTSHLDHIDLEAAREGKAIYLMNTFRPKVIRKRPGFQLPKAMVK